jgi:hypothetical protein
LPSLQLLLPRISLVHSLSGSALLIGYIQLGKVRFFHITAWSSSSSSSNILTEAIPYTGSDADKPSAEQTTLIAADLFL